MSDEVVVLPFLLLAIAFGVAAGAIARRRHGSASKATPAPPSAGRR
jgi:hypothetical protein